MTTIDRPLNRSLAPALLVAGLIVTAGTAHGSDGEPSLPFRDGSQPLDRVAIIGASFSAGAGSQVTLAEVLDACLAGDRQVQRQVTDVFFSIHPDLSARREIAAIREEEPTLVVALDFLFWFVYGEADEPRERRLEEGLAHLDDLGCSVVVGDIPDLSRHPVSGIDLGWRPDSGTVRALNSRVAAWAAERSGRLVIPLSELSERQSGSSANRNDGGMLQADGLHPTRVGLSALAAILAWQLVEAGLARPDDFVADCLEQTPSSLPRIAAGP